ncbi:DUF1254 domain-containing protein [Flavobacterium quisquiliarum]|uniref:DUF1254 domain-containing protein n=1 Tax=Flavobacterium quisquiliarum TaxID=1834436 RepID=A0ABV8W039_9FLAO|nr:DUF1254 domain-containing protein [Flavobacterium quisquiliarum]MBW1654683.1 DUF1214 domain-containing protein [Flavobacterium quisquiliarum]NWL01632.1 hypothetical protein [Flavobacterium collinsii]
MKNKIFILITAITLLISCKKQEVAVNPNLEDSTAVDSVRAQKLPPAPVPNTIMTEAIVKNLTTYIYGWAWPMINIHNRVESFKVLTEPVYGEGILPLAPPNHLCMLNDYVKPEERAVACPNQDVVYGIASLDLTLGPVIVQVPDFGDRFWVYQVCDQRTDGFASLGKMYGTKPGFYLLASKDWKGTVPDGIISVFRSTTSRGIVIPRVFQSDDPSDKKAIQPLINQIGVYPLSDYDGKPKTTEWKKIKSTPPAAKGEKAETRWVKPEIFFDQLEDILKEVPPMKGEEGLYAQIQSLLDAVKKDSKLKQIAISAAFEAEKNYVTPLFQFQNVGYPIKYNWTTQRNGAQFGYDYLTRLSCAKANIFVNKPNETRYFYQDLDENGARLNGANKYTVTFASGEIPPVKGFWSLTLYNAEHFFTPNSLNRYSLGTKNKNLKKNADGSLTLYVQSTPPSEDKASNWLPAPKEQFSLYIRAYWPEEAVLNDSWNPPAVVKVK